MSALRCILTGSDEESDSDDSWNIQENQQTLTPWEQSSNASDSKSGHCTDDAEIHRPIRSEHQSRPNTSSQVSLASLLLDDSYSNLTMPTIPAISHEHIKPVKAKSAGVFFQADQVYQKVHHTDELRQDELQWCGLPMGNYFVPPKSSKQASVRKKFSTYSLKQMQGLFNKSSLRSLRSLRPLKSFSSLRHLARRQTKTCVDIGVGTDPINSEIHSHQVAECGDNLLISIHTKNNKNDSVHKNDMAETCNDILLHLTDIDNFSSKQRQMLPDRQYSEKTATALARPETDNPESATSFVKGDIALTANKETTEFLQPNRNEQNNMSAMKQMSQTSITNKVPCTEPTFSSVGCEEPMITAFFQKHEIMPTSFSTKREPIESTDHVVHGQLKLTVERDNDPVSQTIKELESTTENTDQLQKSSTDTKPLSAPDSNILSDILFEHFKMSQQTSPNSDSDSLYVESDYSDKEELDEISEREAGANSYISNKSCSPSSADDEAIDSIEISDYPSCNQTVQHETDDSHIQPVSECTMTTQQNVDVEDVTIVTSRKVKSITIVPNIAQKQHNIDADAKEVLETILTNTTKFDMLQSNKAGSTFPAISQHTDAGEQVKGDESKNKDMVPAPERVKESLETYHDVSTRENMAVTPETCLAPVSETHADETVSINDAETVTKISEVCPAVNAPASVVQLLETWPITRKEKEFVNIINEIDKPSKTEFTQSSYQKVPPTSVNVQNDIVFSNEIISQKPKPSVNSKLLLKATNVTTTSSETQSDRSMTQVACATKEKGVSSPDEAIIILNKHKASTPNTMTGGLAIRQIHDKADTIQLPKSKSTSSTSVQRTPSIADIFAKQASIAAVDSSETLIQQRVTPLREQHSQHHLILDGQQESPVPFIRSSSRDCSSSLSCHDRSMKSEVVRQSPLSLLAADRSHENSQDPFSQQWNVARNILMDKMQHHQPKEVHATKTNYKIFTATDRSKHEYEYSTMRLPEIIGDVEPRISLPEGGDSHARGRTVLSVLQSRGENPADHAVPTHLVPVNSKSVALGSREDQIKSKQKAQTPRKSKDRSHMHLGSRRTSKPCSCCSSSDSDCSLCGGSGTMKPKISNDQVRAKRSMKSDKVRISVSDEYPESTLPFGLREGLRDAQSENDCQINNSARKKKLHVQSDQIIMHCETIGDCEARISERIRALYEPKLLKNTDVKKACNTTVVLTDNKQNHDDLLNILPDKYQNEEPRDYMSDGACSNFFEVSEHLSSVEEYTDTASINSTSEHDARDIRQLLASGNILDHLQKQGWSNSQQQLCNPSKMEWDFRLGCRFEDTYQRFNLAKIEEEGPTAQVLPGDIKIPNLRTPNQMGLSPNHTLHVIQDKKSTTNKPDTCKFTNDSLSAIFSHFPSSTDGLSNHICIDGTGV